MTSIAVSRQARRLPSGGDRIDRSAALGFTFDGIVYGGYSGDTLASALLANGVDRVATSMYDGAPRGVMPAGAEEPNAIVAVRTATAEEPMLRATHVELIDGLEAWGLPGVGRLSAGPDGGRFDRRYAHCETLVIGGGASGRAAASAAAREGGRVILVDEGPVIEDSAALGVRADLRLLPKATALGVYDHGYVVVAERTPSASTEGRMWHIRAG